MASTHASSHQAVTGTSLIGSNVWKMKSGLKAKSTAAIMPVTGWSTRAPSTIGQPDGECAEDRDDVVDRGWSGKLQRQAIASGRPGA